MYPSQKKRPSSHPAKQSTQQLRLVCSWSARFPQSGSSPLPFPRLGHTLTATATATGELFLFGGWVHGCVSSDLCVFSTWDFSTTPGNQRRGPHCTCRTWCRALIGTTLMICGGRTNFGDEDVLNHDSIYLLNLGTPDFLMSSPTPADHSFAPQDRESGPAWSMVWTGPSLLSYH